MGKMANRRITFIDLFAGAGGLSEGFVRAGFEPVAHIEMNLMACRTLETREAYFFLKKKHRLDHYRQYEQGLISREQLLSEVPSELLDKVINKEMSEQSLDDIFANVDDLMKMQKVKKINVVIGGPPCQAYSLVGRAQSKHMKHPMSEDPRNYLYRMYTRFLERYQPDMFVFENVGGITTAQAGKAFEGIKRELTRIHYHMEAHMQRAVDFGVLQNRKRMIIIGWKEKTDFYYPAFPAQISDAYVNDLLDDLPPLKRGGSSDHYFKPFNETSAYIRKNHIREKDDVLTEHLCRNNNDRDVKIYRKAIEAWNNNHSRLKYDELPDELKTHKNQTSFLDRFKVVEGDCHYCHTVLAHLAKDGHYFIHPDIHQCRSISVREAARLQTFPDNYYFEGGRTAAFVQIGNAVPPLMAKGIAEEIKKQFQG